MTSNDVVFVRYNTYKKLYPPVILNQSLPSDHHRVRPDKPPILSGRLRNTVWINRAVFCLWWQPA